MIEIIKYQLIVFIIGFTLDCIFGDPEWIPHIIRFMGKAITVYSKRIRGIFPKTRKGELAGGGMLVLLMLITFGGLGTLFLWGTYKIHPVLSIVLGSLIAYQMLAMKDLKKESMHVYHVLMEDTIEDARKAVSRIVGRDTEKLERAEIIKATVETVAENTSDGEIAPLFFLAIGGPVLGILYKTVNTMDSMVGYKNEKYQYFGRMAAKLDDILNYIPARIAAFLMILSSGMMGWGIKHAAYIYRRDRYCHASPNSAQTEAVMAGALRVQLAGDAYYFGEKYEKPTIGDPEREIVEKDIIRANQLLYMTSFLMTGIVIALYGMILLGG